MSRIIKNILFIIVIAALSVAIVCTVGLQLLGYQFRAVLTGSMEPDLPVGAMLIVKKTALADLKVGDDITFVRDKRLNVVTHRIKEIDVSTKAITTQGIANNTADAPVHYDNVLGKVVWSIPKLGYVINWLNTTPGKIIAVTGIFSLIIIWMLVGVVAGKKKETDENEGAISSDNRAREVFNGKSVVALGSWLTDDNSGSSDFGEFI